MLNLPRWQTIVIAGITLLSALFALPNLLPSRVLDHLPHWYASSRINLGLDLRGGGSGAAWDCRGQQLAVQDHLLHGNLGVRPIARTLEPVKELQEPKGLGTGHRDRGHQTGDHGHFEHGVQ